MGNKKAICGIEKLEFFDRELELKELTDKYNTLTRGELCILYGRRRLGKTVFIQKFMCSINGEAIYYFVNKTNKKELLDILSANIFDQTGEKYKFDEWEDFFEYLAEKASKEKFVFIMDEFSRLKEQCPEFLTKFQNFWDTKLKNTKIMFVAIGSSMSMMYDIFMDKTAPLYGRMTWKMSFKPFRYIDFREMFLELDEKKKIEIYSVFGGTPHFLWLIKEYETEELIKIIDKLVLSKTGLLRDEPINFITMELRKEKNYNSLLHAISKTNGSRSEIMSMSGLQQNEIDYYLDNLTDLLSILSKEKPLFCDKGRFRYIFEDNFFNFWYRFIFSNLSLLELGNKKMLREKIESDINSFTGFRFEEIIRELLVLYNTRKIKDLELNFDQIGKWWGKNKEQGTEEIEIIANNSKTRNVLFCEVKWQNKKVNTSEVKKLIKKSELVNVSGNFKYMIVSKSGFEDGCIEFMKDKNITHINIEELSELLDKINHISIH